MGLVLSSSVTLSGVDTSTLNLLMWGHKITFQILSLRLIYSLIKYLNGLFLG